MIKAQAKGPLTERKYRMALARNHRLTRTLGIDAVMNKHRLDAIIAPTGGPPWPTRFGQRGSLHGWIFECVRRCRLSAHHCACWLRVWIAGGNFILRPRVDRTKVDHLRLRVRASDEGAPGAEVFGDGELGLTIHRLRRLHR